MSFNTLEAIWACPHDRRLHATEPLGRAHRGVDIVFIEAAIHPRFVIGLGDQSAEQFQRIADQQRPSHPHRLGR